MEEVWKDIQGYEGLYQVSNLGRVRSLDHMVSRGCKTKNHLCKGRILKPKKASDYYYSVALSNGSSIKYRRIHRLLMETFVPNPDNLPCINHKDENKLHNFVWVNPDGSVDLEKSNLEWCSYQYNCLYGTALQKRAAKLINKGNSKKVIQYTRNGEYVNNYPSAIEAERQTGIMASTILAVCAHKPYRYTAGGYKWEWVTES